jgi:hypothetical protein
MPCHVMLCHVMSCDVIHFETHHRHSSFILTDLLTYLLTYLLVHSFDAADNDENFDDAIDKVKGESK